MAWRQRSSIAAVSRFFADWQKVAGLSLVIAAVTVLRLSDALRDNPSFTGREVLFVPVLTTASGGIEFGDAYNSNRASDAGLVKIIHTVGNGPGWFGGFLVWDELHWAYGPTHQPPISINNTLLQSTFDAARGQIADEIERRGDAVIAQRVRSGVMRVQSVYWTNVLAGLWLPSTVTGLLLIVVPSRADRRRKRIEEGRCARCGYAVSNLAGGVCPECGEPIPKDGTSVD